MDEAPAGSISLWRPSGRVQTDILTKWFVRFVRVVKPSADNPASVDGHYSHTRTLDVVVTARVHTVATVRLPPHSTHKIQPLDVRFTAALSTRERG